MLLKFLIKLLLVLVVGLILISIFGKNFLVVNEEPVKSDVIIVLSGGEGRLEKAASLYDEGYAPQVLLTTYGEDGFSKQEVMAAGLPDEALILEEEATSTYTNALYSKQIMEKHQLNSAIVVTSDYHTKRTKFIFERVFEESGAELTFVAATPADSLGEFSWFTAFGEYVKLIGYYLGLYKFIDL
ncbi:YdcF family protein [Lysinibacillus yapensis]|uniref:YdcF family protein n=1 Tax=Ureibacillus yapensis TaxID=2304605 RepID=A0A396SKJ7_9BACL|nr:YdcF family protein [Lysinibacillus yapensis]RHW39537.1 YdcF family protein [Lysinibacillus yapensis]